MSSDDTEGLDVERTRADADDEVYGEDLDDFDADDGSGDDAAEDESGDDVDGEEDGVDDDDDLDDASAEDIDFVLAMYREDGVPVAQALSLELANDLDELIDQLRRLPGDAGAVGAVSIAGEFFVLVRVRGRHVQVLLSDALASQEWPIARDVVEFLGLEWPDDDDEDDPELVGDLDLLVDLGVSELDLENLVEDLDEGSDEQVVNIATQMKFGLQFQRAAQLQR